MFHGIVGSGLLRPVGGVIPPVDDDMLELIDDITVPSDTTQVDFTGLSLANHAGYLLLASLVTNAGGAAVFYGCMNNDTTVTNYYNQSDLASGTGQTASRSNDARIGRGTASLGETFLRCEFSMTPGGTLCAVSDFIQGFGSADVQGGTYFVSRTAGTVADLTDVNIVASKANGIVAGSRLTLYGYKLS